MLRDRTTTEKMVGLGGGFVLPKDSDASDVITIESMGDIRRKSRKNGWSWPPHPLQIASWMVKIYLSTMTFGLLAGAFESILAKAFLYPVLTMMIIFVVGMTFVVTTIDPADDAVREKVRQRNQPEFDRNKHVHVIDNNFCNICEETVHRSSKHCRQCNKCVLDFDHHCKWLNNCVGAKNYKHFLVYVTSIAATCAALCLSSVAILIVYFVDEQKEILATRNGTMVAFGNEVTSGVWLTLLISCLAICAICCALTLHLLGFHIKLIKNGLTTYNFIMDERQTRATKAVPANPGARRKSGLFEGFKSKLASSASREATEIQCNPEPVHVIQHNNENRLNGITTIASPSALSPAPSISSSETILTGGAQAKVPNVMRISSVSENVRFEMANKQKTPGVVRESASTLSNGSAVVPLPPIGDTKPVSKPTKIYDPPVESVINSTGELYLPPILVKSPSQNSRDVSPRSSNESSNSRPASSGIP